MTGALTLKPSVRIALPGNTSPHPLAKYVYQSLFRFRVQQGDDLNSLFAVDQPQEGAGNVAFGADGVAAIDFLRKNLDRLHDVVPALLLLMVLPAMARRVEMSMDVQA